MSSAVSIHGCEHFPVLRAFPDIVRDEVCVLEVREVPKPSHRPVFGCLQYAKTERGVVHFIT